MEFIYNWVRNIILFSLLASIALELIPSDTYKTYTQLFVGFLIIFLVIDPITTVLGHKNNITMEAMQQFISIDTRQMEDNCQKLSQKEQERRKNLYEFQIEQQIKELLATENYEIYSQNVEISLEQENPGKINKVEIVLKNHPHPSEKKENMKSSIKQNTNLNPLQNEREKVKKIIKDFYQLDDSHINVRMQE